MSGNTLNPGSNNPGDFRMSLGMLDHTAARNSRTDLPSPPAATLAPPSALERVPGTDDNSNVSKLASMAEAVLESARTMPDGPEAERLFLVAHVGALGHRNCHTSPSLLHGN